MGRLPVHLALFPGALASGPADSEVPIKRKVCVLGGGAGRGVKVERLLTGRSEVKGQHLVSKYLSPH